MIFKSIFYIIQNKFLKFESTCKPKFRNIDFTSFLKCDVKILFFDNLNFLLVKLFLSLFINF